MSESPSSTDVRIQLGPDNYVDRPHSRMNHTGQIDDQLIEFLGGDPENLEITLNGAVYEGSLAPGQTVYLRQRCNSKG